MNSKQSAEAKTLKSYLHLPTGKIAKPDVSPEGVCYYYDEINVALPSFVVENGKDWIPCDESGKPIDPPNHYSEVTAKEIFQSVVAHLMKLNPDKIENIYFDQWAKGEGKAIIEGMAVEEQNNIVFPNDIIQRTLKDSWDEIYRLRELLDKGDNDLWRSVYQVCKRKGEQTNWEALTKKVQERLMPAPPASSGDAPKEDAFIKKHMKNIMDKMADAQIVNTIEKMWGGLEMASIEHFVETGKVNGSFHLRLKELMMEFAARWGIRAAEQAPPASSGVMQGENKNE